MQLIAYEECWPIAHTINPYDKPYQIFKEYKRLAVSVKNKNASGLADLAINKTEWPPFNKLFDAELQREVDIIIAALDRPTDFWKWIKALPAVNKPVVDSAEANLSKASMPGDKAMVIASTYLAAKCPLSEIKSTAQDNSDFPFWIALDKHNSKGRELFIKSCSRIGLDASVGMKLGFYLEGSKCNEMTDSPYWEMAKEAQVSRCGFDNIDAAEEKWKELKTIFIEVSQREVQQLIKRINIIPDSSELFT